MRTTATKIFVWLFLIATLFLNNACNNEKTSPTPQSPALLTGNERLLLASTFASGVRDIKYNAEKQPEEFVASGMKVKVEYTKSKVSYSYYGKQLLAKKVYARDGELVTNLSEFSYFGESEQKAFATSFTYEGGKVIKEVITFEDKPFANHQYTYDNAHENISVAKTYDHSGNLLTTTTYEYTDKLDKSGSHNEWHIAVDGTLFPKKAKYLVKKATTEDHFEKTKTTIDYEYELDTSGYVLSGKGTRDSGSVFKWSNTWQ
ncbi:hypothetical protein [Dyadobacter aurulentus]|uniref:hypothetical protein n=1 Tax=Dyadobacter sp. UC 10 TaxID=2605428 RepID=UPI0011F23005|nr:hypothetical protein [Dyadobacter sp. UC 10]KAA0989964.1 hypothetical protein FXO21_07215 [Dyadobacter sp. UC 10]